MRTSVKSEELIWSEKDAEILRTTSSDNQVKQMFVLYTGLHAEKHYCDGIS